MRCSIIFILVILISACKKAEDRKCAKTAGDDTEVQLALTTFNKLDLGPNIRYILVQGSEEKIVIRGGENLINFVTANVEDGKLTIRNNNKCNFLRSYKHVIEVEIHLINIINVLFQGTKELTCKNQLNVPYLTFAIEEGAGACNLNLKCTSLYLGSSYGWGNYSVIGETNYLKVELRDNGFGDLYGLQILDSATVISSSSERLKINIDGTAARIETSSYGDIWYRGIPSFLEYNRYGEGNLIDQN